MAVDMFLKLGDVKGESTDQKHKGEIQVLAFSWGESNSGSAGRGTGSGSGKVNMQDLTVTKYVDAASTSVFLACAQGTHYDKAILTVRKAGGSQLEYLIFTLSEVLVASYSTGGSGGEDALTENVSLNFAKIQIKYTPQEASGKAGSPSTAGWDQLATAPM